MKILNFSCVHFAVFGVILFWSLPRIFASELVISDQLQASLKSLRGRVFDQSFDCRQPRVRFRSSVESLTLRCSLSLPICQLIYQYWPSETVRAQLQAEECNTDEAFIFSDLGHEIRVDKTDYQMGGNSWMISLLKSRRQFIRPDGPTKVNFLKRVPVTILRQGVEQEQWFDAIEGVFYAGKSLSGEPFTIVFDPAEKGVEQLIWFGTGDKTFFFSKAGIKYTSRSNH